MKTEHAPKKAPAPWKELLMMAIAVTGIIIIAMARSFEKVLTYKKDDVYDLF